MATTDEYRQAHNISPLSPIPDDEPRAGGNRSDWQWQTFPTDETSISPVAPKVSRRQRREQEVGQEASAIQSPTFYLPETPTREPVSPKDGLDFGGVPELSLQPVIRESQERRPANVYFPPETQYTWEISANNKELEYRGSFSIANTTSFPRDRPQFWNSIWLREYTLIGLAVSFALVAAVILTLYVVSTDNRGLGPDIGPPNLVFLFQYIPTAGTETLLSAFPHYWS